METRINPDAITDGSIKMTKLSTEVQTVLNDIHVHTYGIDFGTNNEEVQVINMMGDMTITEVKAINCSKILLSHGSVLQQEITPGNQSVDISVGENPIWEIARTDEGSRASIGVKFMCK